MEFTFCRLRNKQYSSFTPFVIMLNYNHLLFCLYDQKDSQNVIFKYRFALRHIEVQIDRSNPRQLSLIVKEENQYKDFTLEFEDVHKTTGIKKYLEENRKSARNTEYLLLDSYIDDLIAKWKF